MRQRAHRLNWPPSRRSNPRHKRRSNLSHPMHKRAMLLHLRSSLLRSRTVQMPRQRLRRNLNPKMQKIPRSRVLKLTTLTASLLTFNNFIDQLVFSYKMEADLLKEINVVSSPAPIQSPSRHNFRLTDSYKPVSSSTSLTPLSQSIHQDRGS